MEDRDRECFKYAKKIEAKDRILLLTHTDMDGAGPAVLLRNIFDQVDVIHCSNAKMSEEIRIHATDPGTAEKYDFMIVADISCNKEDAEYIDRYRAVDMLLLDHHITALELNEYPWAVVQPMLLKGSCRDAVLYGTNAVPAHSSGTSLVYDYIEYCGLASNFHNPELAKYFVFLVAGYDTWDWNTVFGGDKRFYNMQTLFMQYGIDEFENVFAERIADAQLKDLFNETDDLILRIAESKKKHYIKDIVAGRIRTGNIRLGETHYTFAYCDASENMSDVFNYMMTSYDVDLHIIDYGTGVSFRSSRQDINVGALVKPFGGGGHPGAGGAKIPFEIREEMLAKFMNAQEMCFDA